MSKKQLYVSRDLDSYFQIWKGRPKWDKKTGNFVGGYRQFPYYPSAEWAVFKILFPQLKIEPGQLAKVTRDLVEVYTGFPKVAVFTLGKIVEGRGNG